VIEDDGPVLKIAALCMARAGLCLRGFGLRSSSGDVRGVRRALIEHHRALLHCSAIDLDPDSTPWSTRAHDTPSALGSSESNGMSPFIPRASR
jgi:hypothetical protein